MEDFHIKLQDLCQMGTITKTVFKRSGTFLLKKPQDMVPLIIENGTWEIENYFHNNEWIAERSIYSLQDGTIYEDKLNLYQGFNNL